MWKIAKLILEGMFRKLKFQVLQIYIFQFDWWATLLEALNCTLCPPIIGTTRKHSSRMCTIYFSSMHPGGGRSASMGSLHPGGLPNSPLDADPYAGPWRQTPADADPLEADPPRLVMWPVIHAGKPTSPPPWTEGQTLVKTLPCPKLRLRAVKIITYCFFQNAAQVPFSFPCRQRNN